jgi:hypothetical protein
MLTHHSVQKQKVTRKTHLNYLKTKSLNNLHYTFLHCKGKQSFNKINF